MEDSVQNHCDECEGAVQWKAERRTETLIEMIGVCVNCGATYSASTGTG